MQEVTYNEILETIEGPMNVCVRLRESKTDAYGFDYELVGATATLVDLNTTMDLAPSWFWAFLEEDAKHIFEKAVKEVQNARLST